MVTTSADVFIDTNVLLRANISSAPLHREALAIINELWAADTQLWISRQVLREYIANVTRPQMGLQPMPVEQVVERVDYFQTLFRVADEASAVTSQLLSLLQAFPTGGKQVHDANIVATMLVYGIDTLVTQNIADFKRFSGKIKLRPLTSTPSSE